MRIPVYRPDITDLEKRYVQDCMDGPWISSIGDYIAKFEAGFAAMSGARHALTVCNGTVALHLAHHCLGVGPGDEVLVPSLTYIASVNTIAQTGAKPVFVECLEDDWQIDVEDAERRITARTKAIVPVHLYGAVCDMHLVQELADAHGLAVVEDASESLAATYKGKQPGVFGDVATFSFFGNKTLTTGEGGMVTCNDDELARRLRLVSRQAQSSTRRYWHEELGFNYRMTNICAAIGLAQLERLDSILQRKRAIAARYLENLKDSRVTPQRLGPHVRSSYWLMTVLVPQGTDRDAVIRYMAEQGVETRPIFYCAHTMPMYASAKSLPISESIAERGISLPSYPTLSLTEVDEVTDVLLTAIGKLR